MYITDQLTPLYIKVANAHGEFWPPLPFPTVISQVTCMLEGVDHGRTLRNIHSDCKHTDSLPVDWYLKFAPCDDQFRNATFLLFILCMFLH